eukprot:3391112-Pleurochrysis_carterae.AAC.1
MACTDTQGDMACTNTPARTHITMHTHAHAHSYTHLLPYHPPTFSYPLRALARCAHPDVLNASGHLAADAHGRGARLAERVVNRDIARGHARLVTARVPARLDRVAVIAFAHTDTPNGQLARSVRLVVEHDVTRRIRVDAVSVWRVAWVEDRQVVRVDVFAKRWVHCPKGRVNKCEIGNLDLARGDELDEMAARKLLCMRRVVSAPPESTLPVDDAAAADGDVTQVEAVN